jgi:hypothetical protein
MGGYYLVMVFFVSCALYDLVSESVTGFTFGYVFALFYFIYRARVVSEHLSYLEKKDEDIS